MPAIVGRILYLSFYSTHFDISFDPILSTKACNQIKYYLENHSDWHIKPIEVLESFSLLKKIIIKRSTLAKATIFIISYEPIANINNNYVLLHNGFIVDSDFFEVFSKEQLYHISMGQVDTKKPEIALVQWINNCQDIFVEYKIRWIDQTKIILFHKSNNQINLLVQANKSISISFCENIQQLITKKINNIAKSAQIIADLRFDDQVIIYSKRGNNEAQYIS